MRILFLCNKSPYPALEGGPMAMNSMIEGMLEAGHEVKVLAVNSEKYNIKPEDIPAAYREKTSIELIDLDLRIKAFDAFRNLLAGKSYHVERFISETFRQKLLQVLDAAPYDVVQLETLYMIPYVPDIRRHSKAVVVLRAHNIEHLIWERIAQQTTFFPKRWYIRQLASSLKQFEINALAQIDGIAAITRNDASFFKQFSPAPVIDIPFGINPAQYALADESETAWDSLFHIGAMNWMPNEEGISWFLEEVWSLVHRRLPNTKLILAGRYMPRWLVEKTYPNVEVVGEVPDAQDFVRAHGISVVPLLSGSGIRIKIIEAMALGKPVVTTRIGAEGIFYNHGENILIAEQPEDFANALELLINKPEKAKEIGRNARKLIEQQYDHQKLIERMLLFYQELMRRKQRIK